jgi:hypothetical protein
MGELNEARGEAAVQKRIERATQPLLDENERLREAGSKVCEAFELGMFTRSTKGDDDPAWAIKLLPYLRALAIFAEDDIARAALHSAPTGHPEAKQGENE